MEVSMSRNDSTRANRRPSRRLIWISAGVIGGLVAGFVLTQSLGRDETGRPTLIFPGHLAHAAQAGKPALYSVADVAERALPSVVNISAVRRGQKAQASPFTRDPSFREFFRRFGGGKPSPRQERSLGSGVIVSASGIVLTNNHVVKGASTIRVTLSNKREYLAKVVGTDPKSDIAVLKLKGAKNLRPMRLGNSDKLRLGDVVLAIGNPFGVGQTVTMGIVSAKGRANMGIVDYEDFIQTDAAINPGNSGGAMVNLRGELVGINTAILSRSGGFQGIGFAIPSNMVQPIMNSLLKRGKVVRGWLGVVIQEVNRDLRQALKLPTHSGILIADVDPRGPARRAGLRRGDLVVKINGRAVDSTGKLRNLVASAGAHATVQLEYYRGRQLKTLGIKLAEQPTNLFAGRRAPRSGAASAGGLKVAPLDPNNRRKFNITSRLKNGVVVEAIDPRSAAAGAGLRVGDVILEVNRATITSVRRFTHMFNAAGGRVLLLVYRQGSTLYMIFNK
jgi:serine protease Do